MAFRFSTAAALLLLVAATLAARQSPIDIVEKDAVVTSLPDLQFINYDSIWTSYAIENTGHSAQITKDSGRSTPFMIGGPLGNTRYNLQQVHFHWGNTARVGSEHLLNGKPATMEVHLVHYNTNYESFEEASTKPDGLAVVALFVEGAHSSRSFDKDFQRVVEGVKRIQSPQDKVYPGKDLLRWMVPFLTPRGYFTYDGSLTTEPYSENVIWVVFKDPIVINNNQVAAFRQMHGSEHDLHENFRDVQPLDGRVVEVVPAYQDKNFAKTNTKFVNANCPEERKPTTERNYLYGTRG